VAANTRFFGVLVRWNEDESSGTLRGRDGVSTPVRLSGFAGALRVPTVGAEYSYRRVKEAARGRRWRAEGVALVDEMVASSDVPRPLQSSRIRWQGLVMVLAVDAVVAAAFVRLLTLGLPWWVPLIYAAASVVAFVAYAIDKRAARLDRWRVSESTLQALALLCGWPGALLAQQLLRHKTRKRRFQVEFWCAVVGNIAALSVIFFGVDALGIPAYI
jgi:uncharacterized membrane protein YsdA (DUF1294 family)